MSKNQKLRLSVTDIQHVPHGSIEVVHPDGWTQIFTGYPATIYLMTEFVDGKDRALEFAKTVMKDLAIRSYYPESGQKKWLDTPEKVTEYNAQLNAKKAEKRRLRKEWNKWMMQRESQTGSGIERP